MDGFALWSFCVSRGMKLTIQLDYESMDRYMDESLPKIQTCSLKWNPNLVVSMTYLSFQWFMLDVFSGGYFPTLYRGGCVSATFRLKSFRWRVHGVTKEIGSSNCFFMLIPFCLGEIGRLTSNFKRPLKSCRNLQFPSLGRYPASGCSGGKT